MEHFSLHVDSRIITAFCSRNENGSFKLLRNLQMFSLHRGMLIVRNSSWILWCCGAPVCVDDIPSVYIGGGGGGQGGGVAGGGGWLHNKHSTCCAVGNPSARQIRPCEGHARSCTSSLRDTNRSQRSCDLTCQPVFLFLVFYLSDYKAGM